MLFTKPLLEITGSDIQSLCDEHYPETDQVEYKEFLPGKEGPDGWHKGADSISEYARDQLFAEVIALANTRGGHLILGVKESSENPKRAVSPTPVPRCHDLATRLTQAAYSCIEPTLNDLQIVGISVGTGDSGVVLFRIRQSSNAPHRLIKNRHCYYRRGENTVSLTMREIQDLTLSTVRGMQRIQDRLAAFRSDFHTKANTNVTSTHKGWVSYRITSVPVTPLRIQPRAIQSTLLTRKSQFDVYYQRSERREIFVSPIGLNNRPVLRGTMIYKHESPVSFEHSAFLDGSQSLTNVTMHDFQDQSTRGVRLSHILGAAASVLSTAKSIADLGSMPAAEFAVEMEITSTAGAPNLYTVMGTTPSWQFDREQFLLPQYSHISEDGLCDLLSLIQRDLYNSAGQPYDDVIESVKSVG